MNVNEVKTSASLAEFVRELSADLTADPESWENRTLDRFLEAMEAWIRALDGYAANADDESVRVPSWSTFAKILAAAKVYE